ncbi:stealth family protein [Proteus sp. LHD240705]|uniref:stealth family protein n=1 Tax=Proteus TaxID=583 RepID=UPI0034D3DC32
MKNNIDVVIYWVDGADPKWRESYKKYHGTNPGRFRDLGTLKYVLRGIQYNLPWVRYIHFITNGQLPCWLNINHPKIKFHTHEEIFIFKDSLPVFNSSAIEINFSNIKGLSERFILFNDDMLVLNYLPEERFFIKNLPVDYLKLSYPRKGLLYKKIKPQNYLATRFINNAYNFIKNKSINSINKNSLLNKNYLKKTNLNNLIFSIFKEVYWIEIYHHPQPHLKSTWDKFIKENKNGIIKETIYSKFRSPSDINQYLFRFINLLNNEFYPQQYMDHLSIYVKDINKFINKGIVPFNYSLLCICEDESLSDSEFNILKDYLTCRLNEKLPYKSDFEFSEL